MRETLACQPATAQDRVFAVSFLLLPLIIATLAGFWLVSGLLGLLQWTAATTLLTDRGVAAPVAAGAVGAGALADLALGAAVLVRPWARLACLGMVALSLAYALGGALLTPDLWADPLGPLVKIAPAAMLALTGAALIQPR